MIPYWQTTNCLIYFNIFTKDLVKPVTGEFVVKKQKISDLISILFNKKNIET